MNEWDVVLVLIAIVGLVITVITPVIKLNSSITELTSELKFFKKGLDEFKERYKTHLKELRDADIRLEGRIDEHEERLDKLEKK